MGDLLQNFLDWISKYQYGLINATIVFSLGVCYSLVELIALKIDIKKILKTFWGKVYLMINGGISILALFVSFSQDVNNFFLGSKILLAGTSALAILRVVSIPVKFKGVESRGVSMIEIILEHIKKNYDYERSNIDLQEIKEIMKGVDFKKASETLPLLSFALLQTGDEESANLLKRDIQNLTDREEGSAIKHIILGCILAKYISTELLKNMVNGIRESISLAELNAEAEIGEESEVEFEKLIEKYI